MTLLLDPLQNTPDSQSPIIRPCVCASGPVCVHRREGTGFLTVCVCKHRQPSLQLSKPVYPQLDNSAVAFIPSRYHMYNIEMQGHGKPALVHMCARIPHL